MVGVTCAQMDPSNSSWVSPNRKQRFTGSLPRPVGNRRLTSSRTPSTPTTGGEDGCRAGLVVKADVTAGDRNPKHRTAIRQTAHGLGELPHHPGSSGRAEVQAVGDRNGVAPVTATLRYASARASWAPMYRSSCCSAPTHQSIPRRRDRLSRRFATRHRRHARRGRCSPDVAVVLLGDECPAAGADYPAAQVKSPSAHRRMTASKLGRGVGNEVVLPIRPRQRTVVMGPSTVPK